MVAVVTVVVTGVLARHFRPKEARLGGVGGVEEEGAVVAMVATVAMVGVFESCKHKTMIAGCRLPTAC